MRKVTPPKPIPLCAEFLLITGTKKPDGIYHRAKISDRTTKNSGLLLTFSRNPMFRLYPSQLRHQPAPHNRADRPIIELRRPIQPLVKL